jgi:hypothetical protein
MKQTAVQWLLEQYLKKDGLAKSDVSRALEIEKQQIIDTLFTNDFDYESGVDYYNQTFDIKEIK